MDSIGYLLTLLLLYTCIVSNHGMEEDKEDGEEEGIDEDEGSSSGEVDAQALKDFAGNLTVVAQDPSVMQTLESVNSWALQAEEGREEGKKTEFDFLLHGGKKEVRRLESLSEGDIERDSIDREMVDYYDKHSNKSVVTGGRRGVLTAARKLWFNRVVPYEVEHPGGYPGGYHKELSQEQVLPLIQKAMETISSKTCITFRPKVPEDKQFITIYKGAGCHSNVGRIYDGSQTNQLSLGDGCLTLGIIQHELLHALGFIHEQSRTDRDSFLTVIWDNIKPGSNVAAEEGSAKQSVESIKTPARFAIDDNINTFSSVTATNPFLQIDLGKRESITRMHIFNRQDCCMEELKGFSININENEGEDKKCVENVDMSELKDKWIECDGGRGSLAGRYVKIYMTGDKTLALAEVKIYHNAREAGDQARQFQRFPSYDVNVEESPYDYQSIMQYSKYSFGDGKVTLVRKFNPSEPLGGQTLTQSDIDELRKMYQCDKIQKVGVDATWSFWSGWGSCFLKSKTYYSKLCQKTRQRFCLIDDYSKCDGADKYGVQDDNEDCNEDECYGYYTKKPQNLCFNLRMYPDSRCHKTGHCPDYCGENGYCCDKDDVNCDADQRAGAPGFPYYYPVCVMFNGKESYQPHWGQWSVFSTCSVTCDEGLRVRVRKCDNPPPRTTGRICMGDRTQTEECRKRKCKRDISALETDFTDGFGGWVATKTNSQRWVLRSGEAFPGKGKSTQDDHTPDDNKDESIESCFLQRDGLCVDANEQRVGTVALYMRYKDTVQDMTTCLSQCHAFPNAVSCGVITRGRRRGCYAYLQDTPKQLKINNRFCWVSPETCKAKLVCHKEHKGMCQSGSSGKIESNRVKLSSELIDTADKKAACLQLCHAYDGATGCASVGSNTESKGCHVFTGTTSTDRPQNGDSTEEMTCWKFEKCMGKYITLSPATMPSDKSSWMERQGAILLSRTKISTATGPKCLNFYYQAADDDGDDQTLIYIQVFGLYDGGRSERLWDWERPAVLDADSGWKKGEVNLPKSSSEFRVSIIGKGFFGSLDDIYVQSGECFRTQTQTIGDAISIEDAIPYLVSNKNCWKMCGNQGGKCDACGVVDGYCCKKGSTDCKKAYADVSLPTHHACVQLQRCDLKKTAYPYLVSKENCLPKCYRGGKCDACGKDGYCCKKGSGDCKKAYADVSTPNSYSCVRLNRCDLKGSFDRNSDCATWKEHGYCYKETKYMLRTCPKSCEGLMDCVNRHDTAKCEELAKKGYCALYPKEMWEGCCVTCHGCLDKYKDCQKWQKQDSQCNDQSLKENCKTSCGVCKA